MKGGKIMVKKSKKIKKKKVVKKKRVDPIQEMIKRETDISGYQ